MPTLLVEISNRLTIIVLMYARITPIFLLLPFLNTSAINSMVIRNALMFLIIIGLWPTLEIDAYLSDLPPLDFAALAIKESLIGASIGFTLALPFWIFSAFGSYIDVARGASMGSLIDPTSGQESTEAANYVNFCVVVVYLELGGMRHLVEALGQSYQLIGITSGFSINFENVVVFLGQLVAQGFVLAAPILLMLLLTECLLGVFSRFTPQLNAFSVSLTIKSVIAFFVLWVYFWKVLAEKLLIFMDDYSSLRFLYGG
jgi:type III secretion system export apparatus protein